MHAEALRRTSPPETKLWRCNILLCTLLFFSAWCILCFGSALSVTSH